MNLLPKSKEEFSQKEYWDSFFKKRGNKAFEWYGEYPELSEHLHKYMKKQDNILITGCGNSTLGRDLYDIGYNKVTNIDISQVVIRQMLSQNEKERGDLKYIQMDVCSMSFNNEEFNVVLDKGTLDALMPNDSVDTLDTINKYFGEVKRVLKLGGRYICISLLQEHILKYILKYFPLNNFLFRIVRCFEAENKASENGENVLPVFMVICTKFKVLPQKVLELNLGNTDKMQRCTEDEILNQISNVQNVSFICSGLKKTSIGEENEVVFDLFEPDSSQPRFTVHVVDIPAKAAHSQYAAFIVPQGREVEWLFATPKGRKKLVEITKHNRLAIITLQRGHTYESFEGVQNELSNVVCNLAPAQLKNKKIPFLSLGSDVGQRVVRYQGRSKMSGEYVIEDVVTENQEKYRRLFYLNTQFVIQSEAKLRSIKSSKGVTKDVVDLIYLTCRHHVYMSLATHMAVKGNNKSKVVVIGFGGGGLCSFLHKLLPKINVLGIEIDEDMVKIAKEWFGFKENEKVKVQIQDGIDWLRESAGKGVQVNALLFDVDSKDGSVGMSCPPKEFLHKETLDNVGKVIGENGIFILNVVLRDNLLRPSILNDLKNHFQTTISYKLEEDLNEIFICSNNAIQLEILKDSCLELNAFFKKHNISENGVVTEKFIKSLDFV